MLALLILASPSIPVVTEAQTYTYVRQWGGVGTGKGQFAFPVGVAVDSQGDVYVCDTGNHRIQRFNGDGTYVTQWGSDGSGNGQFGVVDEIAVDGVNIYAVELDNYRVAKFLNDGTYLTHWGSRGTGNGQFEGPEGVAVDRAGTSMSPILIIIAFRGSIVVVHT